MMTYRENAETNIIYDLTRKVQCDCGKSLKTNVFTYSKCLCNNDITHLIYSAGVHIIIVEQIKNIEFFNNSFHFAT